MHSKNHKKITAAEREHMGKVKALPCSVCDASGGCEAHHIKQQQHYTTVALCKACHGSWHGTKDIWRVYKLDEVDALAITIQRLLS
jgi:hypothetical protein